MRWKRTDLTDGTFDFLVLVKLDDGCERFAECLDAYTPYLVEVERADGSFCDLYTLDGEEYDGRVCSWELVDDAPEAVVDAVAGWAGGQTTVERVE